MMDEPTVTFTFPLYSSEFKIHAHALETAANLDEFRQWMRGKLKHGDGFTADEAWDAYHELFGQMLLDA